MTYPLRNYPVSTAGLSATKRCIDLRQRKMFMRPRAPIQRLPAQKIENMILALHSRRRGFTSGAGWNPHTGDGDITVTQLGGGWHRDCRPRQYLIRAGHVVAIRREAV